MTGREAAYWERRSEEGKQASADSYDYRKYMIQLLDRQIAFDAYCCTLVDPDTLCSIGAVTEHSVEAIHQQILKTEYDQTDIHQYAELLAIKQPVARLSDWLASGRSIRYEEVLRPHGFSDELRCALVFQEKCYGFLTLFKKQEAPHPLFTNEDIELLNIISPIMGEALQGYYLSILDTQDWPNDKEQGVMILDHHLRILSLNAKATIILDALRKMEGIAEPHLPKPIQVVSMRLLAQQPSPAPLLIPVPGKGYLVVQISKLQAMQADTQQLAVSLQMASPKDMLAYLIKAYRLTAREQEVVQEIIKGHSTKEIAQHLAISYHTAQDHLKAIFHKVQVSNRNELVWELLSKYQVGC